MRINRLVLLCSGAAIIMGASRPISDASMTAKIQKLENEFARMANAGDPVGISRTYARDAVIFPPGAPRMEGRVAAQSYWAIGTQQVTDVRLTTSDVRRLSATNLEEFGTYQMRTKTTPTKQMSGKYVVIWQKAGPTWVIATDIWNAD